MASTYLTKTPASAGNRKTFTISFWVKRSGISTLQKPFSAGVSSGEFTAVEFESTNQFRFVYFSGASLGADLSTNRVFRDTNAWYHLVWSIDTTQATASDRVKLYVNGVQETSFDSSHSTYPAQNFDYNFSNNQIHDIGRGVYNSSEYFDGQMAHFHFIDGTAYNADTFGETDSTTGEWKPNTVPSVTYGTNGFFLKFENASSFGEDSSGNDNDFTSNGSPTQNVDTPTNVLATMNVLSGDHDEVTTTNGNLTLLSTTQSNTMVSTLGVSQGKWYWEAKINGSSTQQIGIIEIGKEGTLQNKVAGDSGSNGYILLSSDGSIYNNGSVVDTGSTFTTNDIIGIALDLDNNYIYIYKNGTLTNTGGTSITNSSYFAASSAGGGSDLISASYNFGNGYFGTTAVTSGNQDDAGYGTFEYDVPTGYYTLNTKNINTYG